VVEITIAGAGVGGLASTRGLLSAGHTVRLLESAPSIRVGGAAVTIFSNGFAAMAGLGVKAEDLGGAIERMEFRSSSGAMLSRVDLRPLIDRAGFPVRTVPRDRLIERLAEGVPSDVIQLGRRMHHARLDQTGVVVEDSSGDLDHADILIGADGYVSTVRRCFVDREPARYVGWATWQGLTSVLPEIAASTTGRFLVGDAGFVGMMPAGNGLLQWWFDTPWSPESPDLNAPADWLRDRFAHYADPVSALLREISDDDIGLYPHVHHHVQDRWGTGPTSLVGDAAHAFPPTQAQGANQTLEDAWMLSRTLHLEGDASNLLRRYETRRAPRVRRVSRMATTEATNKPPGLARRVVQHSIPAGAAGRGYLMLIRRWSSVLNDDRP
jgi:FAD-dependent urate hydroxylase